MDIKADRNKTFREELLSYQNPKQVSQATMRALTHLQDYDKEVQLLALSGLLLLICEKWEVHVPDALQIVDNMMRYESKGIPEFRAARDYVEGQL